MVPRGTAEKAVQWRCTKGQIFAEDDPQANGKPGGKWIVMECSGGLKVVFPYLGGPHRDASLPSILAACDSNGKTMVGFGTYTVKCNYGLETGVGQTIAKMSADMSGAPEPEVWSGACSKGMAAIVCPPNY